MKNGGETEPDQRSELKPTVLQLDMSGLQAFNLGFNFGCGFYLAAFIAFIGMMSLFITIIFLTGASLIEILLQIMTSR